MSDTNETIPTRPPSNPNKTVDKDGYRASFYPGFVRRMTVWEDGGAQRVLYEQPREGPDAHFFLPPGYTRPWASSTVEFSRPDGHRIVLQVEDAHQQIDRIEVYLKSDAPGAAQLEAGVSATAKLPRLGGEEPPPPTPPPGGVVLVVEDAPVLCPPACPIS